MTLKALTIQPNSDNVAIDLIGIPDLDFLQSQVGGYIEVVPFFNKINIDGKTFSCVVFCNEEGKLNGKTKNPIATALWHQIAPEIDDVLVGSVVVIYGPRNELDML